MFANCYVVGFTIYDLRGLWGVFSRQFSVGSRLKLLSGCLGDVGSWKLEGLSGCLLRVVC